MASMYNRHHLISAASVRVGSTPARRRVGRTAGTPIETHVAWRHRRRGGKPAPRRIARASLVKPRISCTLSLALINCARCDSMLLATASPMTSVSPIFLIESSSSCVERLNELAASHALPLLCKPPVPIPPPPPPAKSCSSSAALAWT